MKAVYAESSAVLRWLMAQAHAQKIDATLKGAPKVVSSVLTTVEVGRTLRRLSATGVMSPDDARRTWLDFNAVAARWIQVAITDEILRRTTEPFPAEPLRTLDAIHVATASFFSLNVQPVAMLSTDDAVRENTRAMGLVVLDA